MLQFGVSLNKERKNGPAGSPAICAPGLPAMLAESGGNLPGKKSKTAGGCAIFS